MTRWRADTGFSLVEMMVVVAIVGLLAGTVMLSFPDRDVTLRQTTDQTDRALRALARHATISGQVLGVRFDEAGFTVHALGDDGWHPAPDILRAEALGFGSAVLQGLEVDGRPVSLARDGASDGTGDRASDRTGDRASDRTGVHVWFLPTGDRPDFELRFVDESQSVTMAVTFSGKTVVVTDE